MITVDKNKVRAAFNRAADTYEAMANFQHRISERLAELLRDTHSDLEPTHILDGGCGTGYGAELLRHRWSTANLIGCDLAPEMVQKTLARGIVATCGDLEQLPFAAESFDLLWSSLALQWCDPARAYSELHRVLTPDGTLACSTLGTGTLRELDTAFSGVDRYNRVLNFGSRQTLEKTLIEAGFSDIQIIPETWVTRHANFRELLQTIRGIGASQSGSNQRQGMMGKRAWQTAQSRYETLRNEDGMLPVTYEVMFVLARKSHHPD